MINLHHLRDSKTLKIAPKLLRVLKVEQKEFSSVLLEVSSVCSYASVNLVNRFSFFFFKNFYFDCPYLFNFQQF